MTSKPPGRPVSAVFLSTGETAISHVPASVAVLRIRTWNFVFAQLALYPLSHLARQHPFDFYFTKTAPYLSGVRVGLKTVIASEIKKH